MKSIEPYQVLFPIGIVYALAGTVIWILHAFQWISYPGARHTHFMVTGFLITFATGFLLTAVPRFTGAPKCSVGELAIATGISLLSLGFVHPLFALVQLLFLVFFLVRRVRSRLFNPPVYFIFLPVGLVMGIVGAILLLLTQFTHVGSNYLLVGKLFLYYGMMLSFLLGIGAKLIAALLGWAPPPNQLLQSRDKALSSKEIALPTIQALLLSSGFVLEAIGYVQWGRIFRAICVTWIAVQHWRIYRLPKNRGNFSIWIFISGWMLVCGLWTHALVPQWDLHAAHLIFMGGFGLMTLLVASRVTLSHGGFTLEIERKSRIFHLVGLLILVATIIRVTAPWSNNYIRHLGEAAGVWIFAILSWSTFFLAKMIFRNHGIEHTFHDQKKSFSEKK